MSYSRADRALVDQIIHGLRAVGVEVWWDEDMHGVDWQEELERQISELGGVMVVWTTNSANSKHVRDEARLGLETDKLINVMAGVPKPPFPYDRINGLPLDGWDGREPHRGWTRLVATVEEMLVASGSVEAGEITGALAKREADLRQRREAVAAAQDAFQDAQAREGDATDVAKSATTALDAAEEQLQRVAEMRASSLLLRAAQQEADTARAAKDTADKDLRAAKAALSEASRNLSRANAALDTLFSQAGMPAKPASQPPQPIDGTKTRRMMASLPEDAQPSVAQSSLAQVRVAQTSLAQASIAQASTVQTSLSQSNPARPSVSQTSTAQPSIAQTSTTQMGGAKPPPRKISPWVYIGGGLAAAVVLVVVLAGHSNPNSGGSGASDAASSNSSAASAAASSTETAAASLAGNWAPQGLSCDSAITLAVNDGVLSLTTGGRTSTAAIQSVTDAGAVQAKAADGVYTYAVGSDGLSVTGPGGSVMKMTKCAG